MMLFQRIKKLCLEHGGSVSKVAARLGIPQTTFNGYLNEKREANLWPLLPRFLDEFPEINRDWLYFDEGEMLRSVTLKNIAYDTKMVTVAGHTTDPAENAEQSFLRSRVAELEERIGELQYTIALQKRVIDAGAEDFLKDAAAGGTSSAALLSQRETE